jgi:hypothetical protein
MIQALAVLLAAVPALAATTPLEADFPEGYWDREVAIYGGGRSATTYSLAVAVSDPASARAEIEAALKVPGAKLTAFSDQTAAMYQSGNEYGMMRVRPAYNLGYQLPEAKAAAVAHKLIATGRLISYNVQTPFANPQKKEIDDRIEWIEKEMKRSAEPLKTMPVSRAMLESKLKRLKTMLENVKATAGVATISVQIMREDPESGPKPAGATPTP